MFLFSLLFLFLLSLACSFYLPFFFVNELQIQICRAGIKIRCNGKLARNGGGCWETRETWLPFAVFCRPLIKRNHVTCVVYMSQKDYSARGVCVVQFLSCSQFCLWRSFSSKAFVKQVRAQLATLVKSKLRFSVFWLWQWACEFAVSLENSSWRIGI